jgi:lipoprotein signal peptidase
MNRTHIFRLIALALLLVIVDQASKAVVRTTMEPGESISILGGVLRIHFEPVFSGVSWFVPDLPVWALAALRLAWLFVALLAFPVYLFYTQTRRRSVWTDVAAVGLCAGCLGHLLDDLFAPYTTDFIQFFNGPSANFADVYAYAGLAALAVELGFVLRETRSEWQGWRHFLHRTIETRRAFLRFVRRGFKIED